MKPVRTRRAMLGLGVLLMAPVLLAAVRAGPEATPPGTSLAGQLLVAAPEMPDPRFSRTVILMVRHDANGALGIVLNRPVRQLAMAALLDALGLDGNASEGSVTVFAGGPVEPQIGFIIHSTDYRRTATIDIDGRVAMTSDPEILRDIGRRAGPRQSLIAFGYAGWGPGQLENELAAGGWFAVPEDPGLVFDIQREKLWDVAMQRRIVPL